MSPILVRPVREQLEHDRMIRLLQAKFRRKYEAGINPGDRAEAPVGTGPRRSIPDLVLMSQDRGRKLQAVVEVETGESVNHLEALAQWAHFAQAARAFHLYVPAGMVDVARRLCEDNQIHVSEIWSYHSVGDQPRFTLVHRNREAPPPVPQVPKPAPKPEPAEPVAEVKPVAAKPRTDRRRARQRPSPRRKTRQGQAQAESQARRRRSEAETVAVAFLPLHPRQARLRALLSRRADTNRRGKSRTRVLYWYRTPPNVKVGVSRSTTRCAARSKRRIPDVAFDWHKISRRRFHREAEKWRERRRAERAERAARRRTRSRCRRGRVHRARAADPARRREPIEADCRRP